MAEPDNHAASKLRSNLAWRALSACFLVPGVLFALWYGEIVLMFLVLCVVGRGSWEFYYLATQAGYRPVRYIGQAMALALSLWFYIYGDHHLLLLIATAVLICLVATLRQGVERFSANALLTLGGVLYVGLLGSAPLWIVGIAGAERVDEKHYLLIAVILSIWLTDTAAYACGHLWGRRKLAPSISPGKTIVGFAGGLVGGLVPLALYNFLPSFSLLQLAGLLLLVALGGQLGDLVESAIKRDLGAKDAPALIPGHGGILDRFDSYLFAFPLAFMYVKILRIF